MTTWGILTAVLNTLWLGTALAGLVWLALRWLPVNAATRCVIWWVVLAMLVVLPLAPRHVPQVASARGQIVTASYSLPPDVGESPAIVTLPEKPAARWPVVIFAFWAAVLLYRLGRIGQSFVYLRGVKRNAVVSCVELPDVERRARVLVSREITSPMAVWFLHPAVILPTDLSGQIMPEELDQIVLHEAAHLARRDDWWNLAERLIGAVLALHPIAWWILRQIEYEREAASDDWVVARTGAARPYAETLARMVELRWQGRESRGTEALASGVFGRGSRIGDRIEMLLQRGREFSPRVSARRVVAGTFILCCLAAAGSFAPQWIAFAESPLVQKRQDPPPPLVAQAIDVPQRGAPMAAPISRPIFDAASVKATPGTTASDWIRPKIDDSTRFQARTIVEQLIEWAYGVREFQIVGAADWLKKDQFEILGTAGQPSGDEQFRQMVQRLLADRFQLRLHRETREIAVYNLVVGKNGPKLRVNEDDQYCCGGEINIGRGAFIAEGATMPLFVRILTDNLDRPVLDKTGLTGHYDFTMNFDWVQGAAWSPIGPVLFTLVQDLGFRLEPQKEAVEMLVIDSVGHPTEN